MGPAIDLGSENRGQEVGALYIEWPYMYVDRAWPECVVPLPVNCQYQRLGPRASPHVEGRVRCGWSPWLPGQHLPDGFWSLDANWADVIEWPYRSYD